jgi:hypothetical protein
MITRSHRTPGAPAGIAKKPEYQEFRSKPQLFSWPCGAFALLTIEFFIYQPPEHAPATPNPLLVYNLFSKFLSAIAY